MIKRKKIINKSRSFLAVAVILVMLGSSILPVVMGATNKTARGFDKGPSYLPVLPLEKLTFVNFDPDSYLDDYAYLAAVPTAVFNAEGSLYSYPLLFYEDEYDVDDRKELSLNTRPGIEYFMEDWMGYCNGEMDQMTLIGVPQEKLDSDWDANDVFSIENKDAYEVACKLALKDWSYSDNAVVAVIEEEFEKPEFTLEGDLEGTVPSGLDIKMETFYSPQLNKLDPRYHYFTVPEGYKYIKSRTWWAALEVGGGKDSALPVNINSVIPAGDPDSQLYCKYEGEWMSVAVTSNWNIGGMDKERAESYVYAPGDWRLGITDIPTKGPLNLIRSFGSILDILKNMIKGVNFQTDITMYPGVDIEVPDCPPFGCRDATFKLTWDQKNIKLGLSLIGPCGEEVLTSADEESDYQELHLDQLGECFDDNKYKLCVFRLSEEDRPVDFEIEYSWGQNFSREESDSLSSATEGAVLASALNAPLIYTSQSELLEPTKDVLYKLGVKKVYLIDFGGHASNDVVDEIKGIAKSVTHYKDLDTVYEKIMLLTGQNDIIFTTIDPWTRWLIEDRKPYDETEAALFIGPAAYCAAHHGSPVLIVDNHPELSSAVVWHNEYWKRNAKGYNDVPVGPMFLTGKKVYQFLKEHDYDREFEETMITVADQFDIGASWDRVFVGKAKPGRICGSPVDTAYWISRNIFYPALIFENPAMDPEGVTLIQGSESERRTLFPWGQFGLKITKESQEEKLKYPVLELLICYEHNLNDVFEKYYHFQYKTATDIVPGVTTSMNDIDQGMVEGNEGCVWPDLSSSEVIPKYLEKGGYSNVFSTGFEEIISNLNEGVLMMISSTHGDSSRSGYLLTWDPEYSSYGAMLPGIISNRMGYMEQENPWRAYDWYLGSTENPDTLTMEIHGFLAGLLGNPDIQGLFPTGIEIVSSEKPYRQAFFKLLSYVPILRQIVVRFPWLADSSYYKDGLVIAHTITVAATSNKMLTGYNLDENVSNVHCLGWINTACLPAYNYLHIAMMRHGSAFQVIDPWPTSWYGTWWSQTIPRDIILGDTIGEAYMNGMAHVGIQYINEPAEFWWDGANNVCFFGDPDLRPFVPDTTYSDKNHWTRDDIKPERYDEELSISGHMPFGATSHPHEKELSFLEQYLLYIIVIIIIIALIAIVVKKKKK